MGKGGAAPKQNEGKTFFIEDPSLEPFLCTVNDYFFLDFSREGIYI